MSSAGPYSERVLVLAPKGRDGEVAAQLLGQAGYSAFICEGLSGLLEQIAAGTGVVLLAEEAVATSDLRPLSEYLRQQPAWSDLPIVLLTRHGGGPERNPAAGRLAEILGNVTFLERPFHATTLVSVVSTALRSRRRQYDARSSLMELDAERSALSELTATLEHRVDERTAELFTTQEQLLQSQKVESLGHLTGGVAHDFNNLLMAIMGNLELVRKRCAGDERSQHLVDSALKGAQRGAALTQRMLAFARQQDLKTASTNMGVLVTEMRELIERAMPPNIELLIETPASLPPAAVDANQIELAILNLCVNARDAMPAGGTITITLDNPDLPGQQSYLRLQVADTGTGMDARTLQKAIDPFFSTKATGKGTGLGLSMVQGLAVQLGGRFDLASELGKGTVATLWLPRAEQPVEARDESTAAAPAVTVRPVTILVVDDDPLIAMSTADMLEDLGHTVIEANSGQRALEIIDAGQVLDLLMTDQAMPGMTGIELAEIVRAKRPALPVLLATGYADVASEQSVNLPRLSKPYLQAQLQEQISRLVEAK